MDATWTIEVDARPAPFCLDQRSAAMVVVDMQNDFGSAGGMFDLAGIDIAPIRAIVEPIRDLLVVVRQAGIPVVDQRVSRSDKNGIREVVGPSSIAGSRAHGCADRARRVAFVSCRSGRAFGVPITGSSGTATSHRDRRRHWSRRRRLAVGGIPGTCSWTRTSVCTDESSLSRLVRR
jgi:hypothetical protein